MRNFFARDGVVPYAIALHWIWGALLLTTDQNLHTTTLALLTTVITNNTILGGLFILAGSLAFIPLAYPYALGRLTFLLITPQQCLLLLSAWGAGTAVVISAFGDGVVRPRALSSLTSYRLSLLRFFTHGRSS